MYFLAFILVQLLRFTSGEATQTMKVMFFGDSVVSGVHNSEADVCPFRYEFLRSLKVLEKEVTVVGTNKDKAGACQKPGEELSVSNNGYQNAQIDDLLDYVTADLQYLYNPVDYVFTSIGLQDCLRWPEGNDYNIISQSVRRIMGRLLNLNQNAQIYHIPLMVPPSAGKVAVECIDFVNQKLRDVYDPEKNNGRIRVIDPLKGKTLTDDMFYTLGKKHDPSKSLAPADSPIATTPGTTNTDDGRRLNQPLEYLPMLELNKLIAEELIKTLNWEFRAQTPQPTMEVTKEPDYYGYQWCMDRYAEEECFEYYYGYVWCLQEYGNDECYSYYYGDKETWEENDSYKWCLNFYDEEYCSFAYHGEQPDTWEWLSFGYHDCLKNSDSDKCFEQYYGYAWCLNEYSDNDCYEYYYGGDDWVWNEESNYKWCVNFYSVDECNAKYVSGNAEVAATPKIKTGGFFIAFSPTTIAAAGILAGCIILYLCYKTVKSYGEKKYSRLDTRYRGGEDEIGLL